MEPGFDVGGKRPRFSYRACFDEKRSAIMAAWRKTVDRLGGGKFVSDGVVGSLVDYVGVILDQTGERGERKRLFEILEKEEVSLPSLSKSVVVLEGALLHALDGDEEYRADREQGGRPAEEELSQVFVDLLDYIGWRGQSVPLTEVTALKEAYAKLEGRLFMRTEFLNAVLDTFEDGVVVCNDEGKIVLSNPAAEKLVGAPLSGLTMEWWTHFPLYSSDGQSRLDPGAYPLAEALRGEEVKAREVVLKRQGEPERILLVHASSLFFDGGKQRAAFAVLRDVTEAKRAEDDRAKARELQRSNEELGAFASIISHDLRAPLNTISACASFLKRKIGADLDRENLELLDIIVTSSQSMGRMMTDLLTYARVGARNDMAEVDLNEVLEEVALYLAPDIAEVGGVLEVDPMPRVFGSRSQLVQLFQNLVGNSLKFRSEKPLKIEIRATKGDGRWELRVCDNGVGFPPSESDRIFKVFVRGQAGQVEGTGLGLAIVRKIVERHGGAVWAESKPGEGASFIVTLPEWRDSMGGGSMGGGSPKSSR